VLIAQIIKMRITTGPSGPADVDGFIALATHQLWIPLKVAQVTGFVFLILGLVYLYRELVERGEVMLTIAWVFAATTAAIARVFEFTLGAIVVPTFVSSQGASLSQAQFNAVVQGFRALGDGLIFVISVAAGLGIALLSAALVRSKLYHPVIGGGGIVLGSYLAIQEVLSPDVVNLEPLDIPSLVLLSIWFLALGVSMVRTAPETLFSTRHS
jgi:hypothetical protein